MIVMKICVIIPTLNRLDDLKITLNSISLQKRIPKQIIIIDQSDNDLIKNYVKSLSLPILYLFQKEKSSARARNKGIKCAKGDIVCFLDDDVLLDKNYFSELERLFKNKKINGVMGDPFPESNFIQIIKNFVSRLFNSIFFNDNLFKKFCVTGVFGTGSFVIKPKKEYVHCEWFWGCNMSFRKSILEEFQFDNKFLKYSIREDGDLSNRIYKKYPGTLIFSPKLKLIHFASAVARLPNLEKTKMAWVNYTYIYLKNNKIDIKYYWSCTGQLLKSLLRGGPKSFSIELRSFKFTLKHLNKIKSGDINFYLWN